MTLEPCGDWMRYPRSGSWTGWSVWFLGYRARRNDAEWCDREGRSSAFQRKMRPRSGMQAPERTLSAWSRPSPALPDPRFAGSLGRRFGAPHSKELQRSHVPQKPHTPPRSEPTKKVNVRCRKKSLYITVINRKTSGRLPDLGSILLPTPGSGRHSTRIASRLFQKT